MRPDPFPLMLYAAGRGTRMGALTADRPKPLIPVAGRALIDHALSLAEEAGTGRIVVNTHYLAPQLEAHLAGRGVTLSHEPELLETGGGLRAALPLLGDGPVLTLNSDAVWTGANPLTQLCNAWDGKRMDALLLMLPATQARGNARSDFVMDAEGRLARANGAEGVLYLGAQIIRPDLLAEIPERVFSTNLLWDRLIARGRAFGLIHRGGWCDVGRAENIAQAEAMLADG